VLSDVKSTDQTSDNTNVVIEASGTQQSDNIRVEDITSAETEVNYDNTYIQIQGSDRKYPTVLIRRRDRGKGSTIQTISKFGQHAALYSAFEAEIRAYVVKRQKPKDVK